MKAAVITRSFNLEIWDVPQPVIGEYEALCKMDYGATCGGTDLRLMSGGHPNPIAYPTILGHESVGHVVEIGSKVKNLRVGDVVSRVGAPAWLTPELNASWGGFAEYGVAKDHKQMAQDGIDRKLWWSSRVNQVIPHEVDIKAAPMTITWRETLSYIHRVGVRNGSRLLVIGSGANALAFAAHGINLGAVVYVVGNPQRASDFSPFPIEGYFSYKDSSLSEQLKAALPNGADFIIDGIGSSQAVNQSLCVLKPGGTVAIYGWNDRKTCGINPFCASSSYFVYADGYDEPETHDEVMQWILEGKLNASHWYNLDAPVPLDKISEAYDRLRAHQGLKYLIRL